MPMIIIDEGPTAMPPTYQPTPAQLAILRGLDLAPRYLIIRDRPWRPANAILPMFSDAGLAHMLWEIRRSGAHGQVVTYRPDEEDLGPFEPRSISSCAGTLTIALVACLAFAAYAFWRAFH